MLMNATLDIISGICWSLVYIIAIVMGMKRKTWCIPKLAICQNFAWELIIVLTQVLANAQWRLGYAIQILWLVLDIGVLYTLFCYDREGRKTNTIMLLCVMVAMHLLTRWAGYEKIAFLINMIMSLLFLIRVYRNPADWISPEIGILKLIGTLAATILNGIIYTNFAILYLGGICLAMDVNYLYMAFRYVQRRKR